jgi:CRISPR/Cas system CMR-associated protein Cmr1 (group 7 of RAMP superfamily)
VAGKTYGSWDEAVDEVGKILQSFRNRRPPDYTTVKAAMTANQPLDPAVQRAAFGLPIPFYYSSLRDSATLRSTHFERRSSPLWIRVVKLANRRYAVVFLWFRSRFLPTGEKLILQKVNNVLSQGSPPGDGLLHLFLTQKDPKKGLSLKDQGILLLEVHYE